MKRRAAVTLACAGALVASPAAAQEQLYGSGLVTPELDFADVEVRPLRNDAERAAAGDSWIPMPVFSIALVQQPGPPVMIPRALLRADRFRYEDMTEPGVEAVEMYRDFLQGLMTDFILPAAARIPRLAGYREHFTEIEIAIREAHGGFIQAPQGRGITGAPVVTATYGLSNTIGQSAGVALDWDRLLAADPDDSETVYIAANRWLNAYALMMSSAIRHLTAAEHHYDRGVIEALFPTTPGPKDLLLYNLHVTDTTVVVLAHEACHHILDHRPTDGLTRRDQELRADSCAAEIFVNVRTRMQEPGFTQDLRIPYYMIAATRLSTNSMILWPLSEGGQPYPTPGERYANIKAAIPAAVLAATPELVPLLEFPPSPVVDDSFLDLRTSLLSLPVLEPGDEQIFDQTAEDFLFEAERMLVEYCLAQDCKARLESEDANERYFNLRVLIDMAAVKLELHRLTGGADHRLYQARWALWSAEDAVTPEMPIADADVRRLMDAVSMAIAALPAEESPQ
ncbi:MAG: hypothetical protein PSV23_05540 [Brevundimonas sp.]|uniref:hypothetical protein n=1 Tax=Brevundimonas sp. TaxID=1871086 RepID=UPI002487BFA5|nr:hypothetical protein [Brevundimonas sp.]MDI1326246.1 hypothetical protein [Brevundimonas sp.]